MKWLTSKIILATSFVFCATAFAQENSDLVDETTSLQQQANPPAFKSTISNSPTDRKITSLMLDEQESESVERAIDLMKNNQIYTEADSDNLDDSNLSEEERQKRAEAKAQEDEKKAQENARSYIYLASIVYFSPKDWAVWISDKKITFETNDKNKELYVAKIDQGHVKISWKMSLTKWRILSREKSAEDPPINAQNQVEVQFELRPNQTFVLTENKVIEGRAVVALLKTKQEATAKFSPQTDGFSGNSLSPNNKPERIERGIRN